MSKPRESGRRSRPKRRDDHAILQSCNPEVGWSCLPYYFVSGRGLREFPEIASFFLLAALANSKQYCLRRTEDDELYCVGKQENTSPEIILSLDLLCLLYSVTL